jgi:hypothetical protein
VISGLNSCSRHGVMHSVPSAQLRTMDVGFTIENSSVR